MKTEIKDVENRPTRRITYTDIPGIAHREGWLIGNAENGTMEIQKDDDKNIFKSDDEAVEFVVNKARYGSVYHNNSIFEIVKPYPEKAECFLKYFLRPTIQIEQGIAIDKATLKA
jgi:hypothetical protein